jgi:hypothetical protein
MIIKRYQLTKNTSLPRSAEPVFSETIDSIEYIWCIVDPSLKVVNFDLETIYRQNIALFDDYIIKGNLHCEISSDTSIDIPRGCQILGVFYKKNRILLDMLGNPDIPHERRFFRVFSDNKDLPCNNNIIYCGTSLDRSGSAYHIFEVESEKDFN